MSLNRFTAVDLETTGLDASVERIIEIGAVRFIDGKEAERFQTLIYPQKKLPEEIVRLTGITDKDLKDAPYIDEILPQFMEFLGGDLIAAQNAPFDMGFLRSEFARLGEAFYPHQETWEAAVDTAVLGRALLPALESHSLSRLADYFKIRGGERHRAEDDARRCGLVLLRLIEMLAGLGVSEASAAAKILGRGVMAEMFRQLTNYLKDIGASAAGEIGVTFSENVLGVLDPDESIGSVSEELDKVFHPNGVLEKGLTNYETRPRQREMADDISEALFSGDFLMAEAGTGTGKSFAYLIPAILFALSEKQRLIVSTNTKNLQEQLFSKDLPFLVKSLDLKFRAAVLKGRNNYLCRRKWLEILADPDYILADDERTRALTLLFWVNRTNTGDIAENSGFKSERSWGLWSKAASEAGACGGQKCAKFGQCFLQQARKNAQQSHIVVVNHALVLTDTIAENAVLGEYSHIIFDEAHNLEKAAIAHLGLEANIWTFRNFTNKLYRKDKAETGLLIRLMRQLGTDSELPAGKITEALTEVNLIRSHAGEFFGRIAEEAVQLHRDYQSGYTLKIRYGPNDAVIKAAGTAREDLLESLTNLMRLLKKLSDELSGIESDDKLRDIVLEIGGAAEEASNLHNLIQELTDAETIDWVYWWELYKRQSGYETALFAAPLNPGEMLATKLYPMLESAVFTSATMTVAGSFNHFRERLGVDLLPDKTVTVKDYGSPFDYQRQAVFAVPVFIPNPKKVVEFNSALSDLIIKLAQEFNKGMLILFTSYTQLNQVYNRIYAPLTRAGLNVLAQGIEGSRSDIFRRFLQERSILLGTDSFWEGIDAPGEALEILVVVKLPFAVPSEPVVAAQIEKLESQGRNAFMEYTVPEAAVKLRQGVGRLIRSSIDRGAVLICDTRVINTRWGQVFRDSMPGQVEVLRSEAEMNSVLGELFAGE
ncbi:MAG: DEAD/DEAH box helicase family protein [FCB group bacterium]|nr:DEAD/DEAH box helicase family protein [FCB group bacterium]